MAQKQYTFDFVLNAVLNGGFSGVFTKAQQEFIRLGGEIKNLQAIQRDIAAYQKQQQAVENTTGKLENLKKQYELINRQISETTGSTTALEREKLKLEQRISSTEAALEKQRAKLEDTKGRLDAAGVSTDNLSKKDAELTEKIKELTEEQKKATEGAVSFGDKSAAAIDAVAGAITAAGIATAMKEIADSYSECVGVAADFEQAMSAVEAIAEANREEMAALTAQAKEIGATTIYTAQQSGNAMEYMAMAGWDAQEMLAGMKGMTTLAAAAGEDLAQVSDIVTDNLTAFGLRASDTAHFADVLAAAAAKSNTNISIMGETFKSSSSVAGALKYRIEDVAVMVGLMANSAVKGSRAGTAMRNIFNGLLSGATLTAKAFGEVEYSAVNADGSMKDLMETVNDLRYYFDQMTEAERVNNAMNIAGMRGYNGLLAILNATDEDFQSLYDSINNCSGAAERMAAVKLDNLNGDVTIMNSAMEALQSTIGEQFNPELRELARTGTDVLNWANGFIQENPALVKGIMAGGAAFIALETAIVGVNAAIRIFKTLELASLFTGPGGILIATAGAIAAGTAAIVAFNEAAKNSLDESWELTAVSREQYRELQALNAEYERACDIYGETSYEAQALKWKVDELNRSYESGKQTFEEYRAASEALRDEYREMVESHESALSGIDKEEAGVFSLIKRLAELSSTTESAAQNKDAILAIINALNEAVPELAISYGSVAAGADGYIKSLYDMAKAQADAKRMAENYENYVNRLVDRDALEDSMNSAAENARNAQAEYEDALQAYNDAARIYQNTEFGLAMYIDTMDESAALEAAREQRDYYNSELERSTAAYEENEAELAKLEGRFREYAEAQKIAKEEEGTLQGALAETKVRLMKLEDAYTEAYKEAYKSISGQMGLFEEMSVEVETSVNDMVKALESQVSYMATYSENLRKAAEMGLSQGLLAQLADGSTQSAEYLQAIVDGGEKKIEELNDAFARVEEGKDEFSNTVAELQVGLKEALDDMEQYVRDAVDNMAMPNEAAQSARNTIQAFIDEADGMLPWVENAYARLGQAAIAGLPGSIPSIIENSGYQSPSMSDYMKWSHLPGFAGGTDNAPPGAAWVGENGPELMWLHGGEQILPAEASRRLAEEYGAYNRYAARGVQQTRTLEVVETGTAAGKLELHFHIEAGASPETVDAWQDYARSGALKATILEVMEDAKADMKRRAMV